MVLIKVQILAALAWVRLVAKRHVHVTRLRSRAHSRSRPDGIVATRCPLAETVGAGGVLAPLGSRVGDPPAVRRAIGLRRLRRPLLEFEEVAAVRWVVQDLRDVAKLIEPDDSVPVDDAAEVGALALLDNRALPGQHAAIVARSAVARIRPVLGGVCPVKYRHAHAVVKLSAVHEQP